MEDLSYSQHVKNFHFRSRPVRVDQTSVENTKSTIPAIDWGNDIFYVVNNDF